MDDEKLDCLLEKIFSNVNLWLNFAEAKNAANIAFVIATITAIFSCDETSVLSYILCICLVVSGVCSLISFYPKLSKKSAMINQQENQEVNLLFFKDIQKYTGETYIKKICERYMFSQETPTKYQLDLADEIVYNSGVTNQKYILFKQAVTIDIITFILLGVFFVLG